MLRAYLIVSVTGSRRICDVAEKTKDSYESFEYLKVRGNLTLLSMEDDSEVDLGKMRFEMKTLCRGIATLRDVLKKMGARSCVVG